MGSLGKVGTGVSFLIISLRVHIPVATVLVNPALYSCRSERRPRVGVSSTLQLVTEVAPITLEIMGLKEQHEQPTQSANTIMPFPPGTPKPHETRMWGQSLDEVLTKTPGLSSVVRNRLPAGKFPKLWSKQALAPPPALPKDATFRDKMSHRSMLDTIEDRTNHNALVKEQREDWWLNNNHLVFQIITECQRL